MGVGRAVRPEQSKHTSAVQLLWIMGVYLLLPLRILYGYA